MAGEEITSCKSKAFLPADFIPGENHVIIGRGKKCYKHVGNEKLRNIVRSKLEEYSLATCKNSKSSIIMSVVKELRKSTPTGGFIKEDPYCKLWYDVGDFLAREKISQAFRDALQGSYKSSQKNKMKRKKEESVHSAQVVKRMRVSPLGEFDLSLHMYRPNYSCDAVACPGFLNQMPDISTPSCHAQNPSKLLEYNDPFEPTPIYEESFIDTKLAPSSLDQEQMGGWTTKMMDELSTTNHEDGSMNSMSLQGTFSANISVARQA